MPFVGRDRELKLLLDVFARARRGSSQLVTLLGEPGIGKTRLAAELAERIAGQALLVRTPWTQTPEPTPYAQLLRSLRATGIEEIPEPTAELTTDEALLALLRFAENELRRGPLVLVLDNLHLADHAVLDLLEQATDRFREERLMLLCLARDELLERRPAWSGGRANSMTLSLHPLDETASAELAGELDARLRDWVVRAAEGNPLFVEELVTYVREQGLPETGELPPPPTIQALVGSRLDRLDPEERAVLQSASIVGRTFEAAAVEALHGAPVDEALAALARKGLLRRWRAGYVFHHQLLLEVVYRSIPTELLAGMHKALADWYEQTGGGEAMELRPMHLYRAYDYEPDPSLRREVARSLAFTGKRMSLRGNVHAAIVALERAVELVEGDERLPILYDLANVHAEAGDVETSARLWREAERHAAASGDRRLQLHVMLARSDSSAMNARTLAGEEQAARAAIEEFDRLGDLLGLSRAWERLRLIHSYACRGALALEAGQKALDYARQADAREEVLRLLPIVAAQHYWGPTPAHEALPELERILDELGSHPSGRGNLLWMIGGLHAMLGRFDQGRRCYREASRLNIDLGRTIRDAGMTQVGAAIELLAGDPRAAEAEARRGSEILERAGETEYRSSVVAWIGRALAAQGRLEPARAAAEQALELGADDDEVTNTLAHAVLAEVHARLGDATASDGHAARVHEVLGQTDEPIARADALADLTVAALALGRDADALRAEAQAVYEAKGSVAGVELLNRRCTTTTPARRS